MGNLGYSPCGGLDQVFRNIRELLVLHAKQRPVANTLNAFLGILACSCCYIAFYTSLFSLLESMQHRRQDTWLLKVHVLRNTHIGVESGYNRIEWAHLHLTFARHFRSPLLSWSKGQYVRLYTKQNSTFTQLRNGLWCQMNAACSRRLRAYFCFMCI